jgi:hypothetical protein
MEMDGKPLSVIVLAVASALTLNDALRVAILMDCMSVFIGARIGLQIHLPVAD